MARGRQPLRQAQAGWAEPNRKFVSARRDILITNVGGRDGAKLPIAREIRGAAAAHGRKRAMP